MVGKMFKPFKRFIVVSVYVVSVASIYAILLWPSVQNQDQSKEIRCGRYKIGASMTRRRAEIWLEGWAPGVRQSGWVQWK